MHIKRTMRYQHPLLELLKSNKFALSNLGEKMEEQASENVKWNRPLETQLGSFSQS